MGYIKYVPRDLDIHMLKLLLGGCSEERHGYKTHSLLASLRCDGVS